MEHEGKCDLCIWNVAKGLVRGLEELEIRQVETIQTKALLRSDRLVRRVLNTCCHSESSEKKHQLKLAWKSLTEVK